MGNFYDRVLCHELCHAFCLSYNLTMDIQTEEIVADFLATYGREVFALADELIRGIVGGNVTDIHIEICFVCLTYNRIIERQRVA